MKTAARWMGGLLAAALFLAPLLWMIQASFRPEAVIFQPVLEGLGAPEAWTLQNYADGWRRSGLGSALLNSLIQVGLIAGGGLIVNSMAAFAFARMEFRGREALFAFVVALIILPVEVLAVPMFLTVRDLHLTGGLAPTLAALSLPFVAKAFNIYFLRQHFLSVPTELEEAAVMDGAGIWRRYWNIGLPAIRPALATVVLLDLAAHWGDFLWPLMVCTRNETRTVQLSLANLFTQPPVQWGDILACAVMATLPIVLLFRWLQSALVRTDVRAGIR